MRNILLVAVLLLWALLGLKMCNDYTSCCAGDADGATEAVSNDAPAATPAVANTAKCPDSPICFLSGDSDASYGTGFSSLRDSIIGLVGDGQKLRIVGTYGSEEENTSSFANLGVARAENVKSQIAGLFDANRIETAGQLLVGEGSDLGPYSSDLIRFTVVGEETAKIASSTLIYFPFNSTNKLDDSGVESYLQSVAKQINASGERVRLTGHTDDVGSTGPNQRLGLRRAQVIRDYLIAQGVASNKIIVDSKGESQPVATNATEVGRAKNRRTELQIIN